MAKIIKDYYGRDATFESIHIMKEKYNVPQVFEQLNDKDIK